MSVSSWPSELDIAKYMTELGYEIDSGTDVEALIERAIEELHGLVGFEPFLATDEVEVTQISVNGVVNLNIPFAEISEITLELNSIEFSICPTGSRPIKRVTLGLPLSGPVNVKGKPGYGIEVPRSIWFAVRDLASSYLLEVAGQVSQSAIEMVKQDTVSIKYQNRILPTDFALILNNRAVNTIKRYKFLGLGG